MTRIFKHVRRILPGLAVCAMGAPLPAAPEDRATTSTAASSLLTEAYRLTAAGQRPQADAVYQQLLQCCPDEGYPAYARYLSRTGQTTAVQDLLTSHPGLAAQPVITRARAHIIAGRQGDAITLLRSDSAASGTLYTRTVLLANQLDMLGESATAATEIEKVLASPELSDADRRDLFGQLVRRGGSDSLARVLPTVVDSIISSSTLDYPQLRTLALDGLTALSMGPGYPDFHAALQQRAASAPSGAWLAALSSIRKGDNDAALALLEGVSTSTLSARQLRVILEEKARLLAGDTERTIGIYRQLVDLDAASDRLRLQLAQQYFRAHKIPDTVAILKPLNFAALDDGERMSALNLYLTSLGSTGPMPDLVTEYLRLSAGYPYQRVRDIASAPFPLFSPDNTQPLRTAIDDKLANTSGTQNLYILLMSLENLVGNQPAIAQALEKYTTARPNDVDAVMELADLRAAEAWQLVESNPATSAPLAQLQSTADTASRALWNAVRLKPYAPEPYNKLMALYTLYNQPDKARAVPLHLAERPNATAEEVHLAAYIYATQGYPELSIPLYERALAMQDDTRFRLNYAAALGRVNRYDDAMAIYRKIIQHGVNGRQYHIHEVHATALALAIKQGRDAEHLDFLEKLRGDKSVPQRDEFLLGESKVLASAGYYPQALQYLETYREEYPAEAVTATDAIVSVHVEKKDFNTARAVLAEQIAATTQPEQMAFLRNNVALTHRLEGNLDAAVAEWLKLAQDLPTEHTATHGLINAARALAQSGRINEAQTHYTNYIKLNTGDVTGEQIARDELASLGRMEVPTDMLVKSAMMEYGAGGQQDSHAPATDTGHEGHNP